MGSIIFGFPPDSVNVNPRIIGVQNVLHNCYNLLKVNDICAPAGGATLDSLEFP